MHNTQDSIRIKLNNDLQAIFHVRQKLSDFAQETSLPQVVMNDVMVIVDEILSNTIKYGCKPNKQYQLEVEAKVEADKLLLLFIDNAEPFNPLELESPNFNLDVEDRAIGGLGIGIVIAMTESQSYTHTNNKNILAINISLPT